MEYINSKKFGIDDEATQSLLSSLAGDKEKVTLADLSSFMRESGVIVKLHTGHMRLNKKIDLKALGIDISGNDDAQKFIKSHMENGTISLIPYSDEKELTACVEKVRMYLHRNTRGLDDSFLRIKNERLINTISENGEVGSALGSDYDEFMQYYNELERRFFRKRDEILSKWDELVENFRNSLNSFLKDVNAIEKDKFLAETMADIPSKKNYSDSFYVRKELKAFPIVENFDLLPEELRGPLYADMESDMIATAYEMALMCLNRVFVICDTVNEAAEKMKTAKATVFSSGRDFIVQTNVVSNEKINELCDFILELSRITSPDEASEKAEEGFGKAYKLALELGLSDGIECRTLSKDQLNSLAKLF